MGTARGNRGPPVIFGMFSFLRGTPSYRLGLDLRSQSIVAVMLDHQGVVQQRREGSGSTEFTDLAEMLPQLLSHFPIQQCEVVMSLTPGYNFKVADLKSREPLEVRYEAERWLPYNTCEASFAWHALGSASTLTMAYPTELLNRLANMLRPLRPRSLAWEIREMVYARTLNQAGLPAALAELSSDWLRLAFASEEEFYSVSHYLTADKEVNLAYAVERLLDYRQVRRKPPPQSLWVNAAAQKALQKVDLELLPLSENFVAVGLANSPAGTHQFTL